MLNTIFHIDESQKWNLVLGNVNNMLVYCKEHQIAFTIEVLANSEAVKQYMDTKLYQKMELLALQGIQFVACNNALQGQHMNPNQLFSFINVVPAGVVELAIKQQQGFAYIKP